MSRRPGVLFRASRQPRLHAWWEICFEEAMRCLALDTALDACQACVADSALSAPLAGERLILQRGHAEALMPLVQRVVRSAGGFSRIGRVVTTVGPGSFTGLRVAISAARGLALALDLPCVGVSTLEALAAPFIGRTDGRTIGAAVDARHGNVYFQLFSPGGRPLIEARCAPLDEAAELLRTGFSALAGPGAGVLARHARATGAEVVVAETGPPDIAWVARLGLAADPGQARPDPLYLKPADVTPQTGGRVALR